MFTCYSQVPSGSQPAVPSTNDNHVPWTIFVRMFDIGRRGDDSQRGDTLREPCLGCPLVSVSGGHIVGDGAVVVEGKGV